MSGRIITARTARTAWNPGQKPPYGARLNPSHPLSQGLVGAWLFNEGGNKSFDIVRGIVGNYQGTISPVGDGITFSGATPHIDVNELNDYKFTGPFSVLYQLKSGSSLDYATVYCKGVLNSYRYYEFMRISGGNFAFGARTDAYKAVTCNWLTTDANRRWNVGLTWGPVNNGGKYYIDGIDKTSGSDSYGATTWSSNTNFRFGILADDATRPFLGTFYYLYLYNRELSAGEVRGIHVNPYQMFWHPLYDSLGAEKHRGFVTKEVMKPETGLIRWKKKP